MAHPLLARQLKRLGLFEEEAEPVWRELLARVARAYADADNERYLLERSLSISSREMRDLNDRLRSEAGARLAEERDRLRAVIGSLGAGLAVLDSAGRIASVNPEAERLLGWAGGELAGKAFFEVVGLAGPIALGEPSGGEEGGFRGRDGAVFPAS